MPEQQKYTVEDIKTVLSQIEAQEFINLHKKVKDGGILKLYERERFESLEEKIIQKKEGKKKRGREATDENYLPITMKHIANIFNLTLPRLTVIKDTIDTFPHHAHIQGQYWNGIPLLKWFIEYRYGDSELALRKAKASTEKEEAKAKREMLLAQQIEGQLKPVRQVLAQTMLNFSVVAQSIRDLPERVAPEIPRDASVSQIAEIIRKHTEAIMRGLHANSKKIMQKIISDYENKQEGKDGKGKRQKSREKNR